MTLCLDIESMRDGYVDLVAAVRDNGRKRSARGYATRDVGHALVTVRDTRRVLPYGVGRQLRPEIGYGEALQLVGGFESPSLMASISPTFRRFMDGGALAGSYGPLTRTQMPHVVETLRGDRDSRQAVVQVHPGLQNVRGLRDVPCTLSLGFELRRDGLHSSVSMRSSDVWLGTCYDVFQFTTLGHTLANVLGVELQTFTFHTFSLHLYERDVERAGELHYASADVWEPYGFVGSSWEDAREHAEAVYERGAAWFENDSEEDFRSVLEPFDRLTRTAGFES